MELATAQMGDTLCVTVLAERIDAAVAIRFKDAMREITSDGAGDVVLDLSRVDFVDSSGLGAIVAATKQLGGVRRLDLAGLNPNVEKVFRLTRMNQVFRIHASVPVTDARVVG